MKPRLLDLFCGAGGCARGYMDAGFYVVGVDINPQPHYCGDEFYQADALQVLDILISGGIWQGYRFSDFAVIHASPPCQDYSSASHYGGKKPSTFPRLLGAMRKRLLATGKPWILENVAGAKPDMLNPVMICGTALGLRVQRHRFFESNYILFAPGPCNHRAYDVSVRCKRSEYLGAYRDAVTANGHAVRRPPSCQVSIARIAMDIDWMTGHELGEAIPPAYTRWIGSQIMDCLKMESEATA